VGVRFENVMIHYRDDTAEPDAVIAALDGLSVRFAPGRFTALLGAPGSGKSTLLMHVNGLVRPGGGRVRVFEFEIGPDRPKDVPPELRRRAGLVFQFPEQQLFEATVRRELMFAPLRFGLGRERAERAAAEAAELLGIGHLLDENPLELSSGQRRKVAIAAVIAADPDLVALDEPTASLDPASRAELVSLLARLCRERGKTVIMATHRLEDVLGHADECAVLAGGRLLFAGTPQALLARPDVMKAAGLSPPPAVRLAALLAEMFRDEPPAFAGPGELAAWTAGKLAAAGEGSP